MSRQVTRQATDSRPLQTHTSNMGAKGRTVVPQAVREVLHVGEGDTLLYLIEGEQVRLTTRQQLAQELYGSLAEPDGRDFTQELLEERRAEAERAKP